MKKKALLHNVSRTVCGRKGGVLPIVLLLIALISISTISMSTIVQRDARIIQKIRDKEKARFMAEAGVNEAFAMIKMSGFASRSNFNNSLDTGSYSVVFTESGGRHLVTSVGNVSGATATSSAEVVDKTPTALNYFSGAGNDVKMKIHTNVNGRIIGDIHANNDDFFTVQPHARLDISGDVSATGVVQEGNQHYNSDNKDQDLFINGLANDASTIYEGETRITFPVFDFMKYKEAAIDSGDYYDSDQTFNSQSFSPANGVVYVDGDVVIIGTCTINGGLIADNIIISGTLEQVKTGDRNVIAAKDKDIIISGRLEVGEAIVFASQDITTRENWGAQVYVNGTMLAKRDVHMWNFRTEIDYTHVYIYPIDMTDESSGFSVESWTQ
ncbi:pilus assembly PilX N-terminal domain-containing protein [Candidatus Omnitrophota bacterium]